MDQFFLGCSKKTSFHRLDGCIVRFQKMIIRIIPSHRFCA